MAFPIETVDTVDQASSLMILGIAVVGALVAVGLIMLIV